MNSSVRIEPNDINSGDKVRVDYNGLLAQSGAHHVYLHTGMGIDGGWNDIKDIEMRYEDGRWTTELEVGDADKLNFCFKDCADNWDNNNGYNWSYQIHN